MANTHSPLVTDPETVILLTLEEAHAEIPLPLLLELLGRKGLKNDAVIKATLWRLIDQKKIEMTAERKLRPAEHRNGTGHGHRE